MNITINPKLEAFLNMAVELNVVSFVSYPSGQVELEFEDENGNYNTQILEPIKEVKTTEVGGGAPLDIPSEGGATLILTGKGAV